LSQFMRSTDGQTDGFTIAKTALHKMQCGNNASSSKDMMICS